MIEEKSILFVCSGNVFRSVAAEQCFKKYLVDNAITDWDVGSAGIIADPASIDPKVLETLREFGIDDVKHEQRRLTREILEDYDVVFGMAENHIEFMKSEFGYTHALLFNDLAAGEQTSIWDIEDDVADYATNRGAVEEKIKRTVKEIHHKTPELFKNASERFYLFSDFVSGKTTHRNGYPFITLCETPHSIAFMSLDIPYKEDGHILVIPKKRYIDLSDIPNEVLGDIIGVIKRIGNAIIADHGGYNVLLNNGRDAGQYMMHTHFHIIPRRSDDGIRIEFWKHPRVSREEFVRLNEKLKRQIAQAI
ncbi:MAG: HIT domain-containing protein [bacterium]|nr:HIT domain-containing protein [bacterium]